MSAKLVANWRIPSESFYPFSLYSVGNIAKTVFIVPGDREVYTLVVKNLAENIRSSGSPSNVTDIKLDASLVQVVALAEHTVGLKENGELVVFSSSRECQVLQGTSGVRAICAMEQGTKLALMRLLDEDKLQLEVVDDVGGPRIGSSLRTFDLSWEKSDFPISRKQQSCTIGTALARPESLKFFQRFLNCKDLTEGTELILFTLDNGLYWIKLDGDSYEVVAVKLFSARIKDFNFASCTSCFSTLLDNSVLNVCSISDEPENLLIQECNICLGHSVEAHQFVTDLGLLIYSNQSQLIQLKYFFSELSKTIEKESKELSLAGVTALSYVDHVKLIISITENRLVYSTPISPTSERANYYQNDEYFELTDEALSQAKQMTCLLTNEAELNRKIAQQVADEKAKIEILSSVSNKSYFKNFVDAQLQFHRKMTTFSSSVILLGEILGDTRLMAEVQITFKNNFQRVLNKQKQWMIVLQVDAKVHHIQLDALNLDNSIRMVLPHSEQYLTHKGLATISVSLARIVHHARDGLSLQIPIKLKSSNDLAHLLEFGRAQPLNKLPAGGKELRNTIRSLVHLSEQRPLRSIPSIEYRLKMPSSVGNLASLLTQIGLTVPDSVKSTEQVYLCLGGADVEVRWDAIGSELSLKSNSPAILMVLKMLCSNVQPSDGAGIEKLKTIQQRLLQSEQSSENVISLYRQLRQTSTNSSRNT